MSCVENKCECTECKCDENTESQVEDTDCDCSCNEVSYPFSDTEDDETEEEISSDDYTENDDKHCILHGRWIYDDSNSIDEMIEALQKEIVLLTDLKNDGWVLQEKVMDDSAYLVKVDEE